MFQAFFGILLAALGGILFGTFFFITGAFGAFFEFDLGPFFDAGCGKALAGSDPDLTLEPVDSLPNCLVTC